MPRRPLSQAEVVARIEAAYPGEYDMSKLVYKHSHEKFVVICAKHKEFEMNVVRLRQVIDGKSHCVHIAMEKSSLMKRYIEKSCGSIHGLRS